VGYVKKIGRSLRIKHWSKQSFVFLGFLFGAFWENFFLLALIAALSFSFAASSVYLYNDIEDLERDRYHPEKAKRPLASGELSVGAAYFIIFLLNGLSFALCAFLSVKAALIISLYLLVNVFYSNGLKHYPLIDVLCIGSGFMLRILMGTWAIGITPSKWILVCGTALSLFLAFSKRKLEWQRGVAMKVLSRPVLKSYNRRLLNVFLMLSSLSFLGTYIFYAYFMSYQHSPTLHLMLTIPFVLFGFFRYLFLMSNTDVIDCPVTLFLSDRVSLINLSMLLVLSIWALHSA
jgi:4-hydroxybenzoate polyprenyltransferase